MKRRESVTDKSIDPSNVDRAIQILTREVCETRFALFNHFDSPVINTLNGSVFLEEGDKYSLCTRSRRFTREYRRGRRGGSSVPLTSLMMRSVRWRPGLAIVRRALCFTHVASRSVPHTYCTQVGRVHCLGRRTSFYCLQITTAHTSLLLFVH